MISEGMTELPNGILLNDKYVVIEPITSGRGGFGRIYKIEENHPHLGKQIHALKQLILKEEWDEKTKNKVEAAFLFEAKTLINLRISSVPRVKDFFIEKEYLFLVMDYIQGDTLETIVKKNKPTLSEAISIIEKVLETLRHLHTNNPQIIHRDIKPSNIILQDEKVWLVDFGLAKNSELGTILPGAGSPFYSPPEQFQGSSTNERADIYSVGATFYYLLTGQDPTNLPVLDRALTKKEPELNPIKSIREVDSQIPEIIAEIVHKALETSAKDRFASADEMLRSLQKAKKTIDDSSRHFKNDENLNQSTDEKTLIMPNHRVGNYYSKIGNRSSILMLVVILLFIVISGIFIYINQKLPDYQTFLAQAFNCEDTNYDCQITNYTKAIEIKPDLFEGYHRRGLAFFSKKDYDQAFRDFNIAIKLNPNSAPTYSGRGSTCLFRKDYDQALRDFNKAIELNPGEHGNYTGRGAVYASKNDAERALRDFNKAIEIEPNIALAYDFRAKIYSHIGKETEAKADRQKYEELTRK